MKLCQFLPFYLSISVRFVFWNISIQVIFFFDLFSEFFAIVVKSKVPKVVDTDPGGSSKPSRGAVGVLSVVGGPWTTPRGRQKLKNRKKKKIK